MPKRPRHEYSLDKLKCDCCTAPAVTAFKTAIGHPYLSSGFHKLCGEHFEMFYMRVNDADEYICNNAGVLGIKVTPLKVEPIS